VPLAPPFGVQPSPVWLPAPAKIGGPMVATVHVLPWSVERAASCGMAYWKRASKLLSPGWLLNGASDPDTTRTVPAWATSSGAPKKPSMSRG
jgi:hypothetical protein